MNAIKAIIGGLIWLAIFLVFWKIVGWKDDDDENKGGKKH